VTLSRSKSWRALWTIRASRPARRPDLWRRHQIRNPLNAMDATTRAAAARRRGRQPITGRVERVRHEIRRLDQAVDALLRFMRPEKLRLEPLAINDLLSQAGDRAVQPGIKVEYHLGPSVPMIRADGAVLTEALENLVRNAVEAMPNGGKITISSKGCGA